MTTTSDIEVRRLPAQTVAHRRYRGTLPSIEPAINELRSWVVTMGYSPQGPLAIQIAGQPTGDPGTEYDLDVQLPVQDDARTAPSDLVQVARLEETDAAVLTIHGPCDVMSLDEPLRRLRDWMGERGLAAAEVVRWVEVTDPTKVAPDEMITELQELLQAETAPSDRGGANVRPAVPAPPPAPEVSAGGEAATAVPPETQRIASDVREEAEAAGRTWYEQQATPAGGVRPWWATAVIAAAFVGLLAAGVIIYRRRQRQRRWTSAEHWKQVFKPGT
jgi:effector-binding domain-containing protein